MKLLFLLSGGPELGAVARLAAQNGFSIEEFTSFEALEARCSEGASASLVLLDYDSPQFDVLEVCRHWKLTRPLYHPSLIFVSGVAEPMRRIDALRTGANLVLCTPFEPELVLRQLNEEAQRFEGVSLPLRLSLTVQKKEDYLSSTNRFLDLILYTTKASSDTIEDLRLCMGELGMNAIVHGNKNDPRKNVFLDYQIEPERVLVTVKDEGEGFNPDNLPDPTSPDRLLIPSGRGVFLVRQYTDELIFDKRGTEVRFVKLLR